jgi:chaperone modulatory protein CbpM
MHDDDIVAASLIEDCWLTLEQLAAACDVEPDWLRDHLAEGLLPSPEGLGGVWRSSSAVILRARRMRRIEADFDAVPELAALVADLLEEIDRLRSLRQG